MMGDYFELLPGQDFDETCPHCDYVNRIRVWDTTKRKDGKRTFVCQDCGKIIFACSLCDGDGCGKCEL